MTNLQKNPEYHNISLSERQGKVGGWLRGQLQSRIARPLSFRAKHAPCHCNQSMPSVISSEARSAKSRNLFIRAKPSLCHFERSPKGAVEKSAYPTKTYRPPAVASCRVAAPCHFERSTSFVISSEALLLSFRAMHAPIVISSAARSAKSRNLHIRLVEMTWNVVGRTGRWQGRPSGLVR